MRRVVRVLLATLCLTTAFVGQTAVPDRAATSEDVQRLLSLTLMRERISLVVSESPNHSTALMTDYLLKQVPGANKRPEQVEKIVNDWAEEVYKGYPVDSILEDMVPIYQKHLTEPEVQALLGFYSSPIGQKMLREVPAILTEVSGSLNSRIQPHVQTAAVSLKNEVTRMLQDEKQSSSKPSKK